MHDKSIAREGLASCSHHSLPAAGGANVEKAGWRRSGLDGAFTMLEAFVIIVALGGLEIILWYLDHREQRKEIELLDSIWAELVIRNSEEDEAQMPRVAATHR